MSPKYVFRIDALEENIDQPLTDNEGRWIPSADSGSNRLVYGGITGRYWYCDGQDIAGPLDAQPRTCAHYKTYSIYYDQGFWVFNGDVVQGKEGEAWHRLSFTHDETDYSSYLTNAGEHHTLRTQRFDQRWPQMLLPDIYHIPAHLRIDSPQYGGLNGELPIFLALIAFSIHPNHVGWALANCFKNGSWLVHQYSNGRESKRGMVVRVWACPPDSLGDDLAELEAGHWGNYFN
ncbi:hypothetical protein K432DRAFT_39937 [Lepidopterella palustris CBS 459.81]|uniref:Uncharacterized protein n=1 Tax=Lepidopterella palustris CBS 459.81 TaxID=1314670 RepID=A0A8E2EB76_9PEZI|nr:hypothetical protein K432DRAFT_39937 [Lepidopterella palustris CBS 459.81]